MQFFIKKSIWRLQSKKYFQIKKLQYKRVREIEKKFKSTKKNVAFQSLPKRHKIYFLSSRNRVGDNLK